MPAVTPQVAISKDFLEALARLPLKIQKKVREFTEKFRKDPTQPGINFERIADAKDDKVRSARIDQTYRAIIVHPPRGDVYLCAWVDHHDDAYAWARNRRFEVNPVTGTLQVFGVEELEGVPTPGAEATAAPAGLLAAVDDESLLFSGVPAPLLPAVRALETDDELDVLAPHFPEEAAEMLYLLAAGYDFMQALEEIARKPEKPERVDVEDFATALAQPDSKREFRVVEGEVDLAEMLEAPLEQWRIFLHPSQRKLVEWHVNGPIRVLGGAGTGKTVALMHRAKHLAKEVFTDPEDRVLVTTFTRNLALDLEANLKNLCGSERSRIETTNLHSWAIQFLRRQGITYSIIPDYERRQYFEQAYAETENPEFPLRFYIEEWEQVAQPHEVVTRDDYLKARRVGRGTRVSRAQRLGVWRVFERYRELLDDLGKVEWPDIVREARLLLEQQQIPLPYRSVLVDETQDLKPGELRLLRAIVPPGPDDLFLVGDGHQRIYSRPVSLSKCGIEIRGRSRRLRLNYRTTQKIRNYAVALLEGLEIDDLDDGTDDLKGYTSLRAGVTPEVRHFAKDGQEAEFIVEKLRSWLKEVRPDEICLTARTNNDIKKRYKAMLESAGIPCYELQGEADAGGDSSGVRLATMHRMKGLEFPRVLIAGLREGVLPLAIDVTEDEATRADHELRERCLFYVAATRARDELVVTGFGTKSPWVRS